MYPWPIGEFDNAMDKVRTEATKCSCQRRASRAGGQCLPVSGQSFSRSKRRCRWPCRLTQEREITPYVWVHPDDDR